MGVYQNSGSSSFSYYFLKQSLDFHKPGLCLFAKFISLDYKMISLQLLKAVRVERKVGRGRGREQKKVWSWLLLVAHATFRNPC